MQWKGIPLIAVWWAKPSQAFSILKIAHRNRNHKHSWQTKESFHISLAADRRHHSETRPINVLRGVKKENLPSKLCVTCGRPFTWRKKWERVWDEVTTCSKSCNRKRRAENRQGRGKNVILTGAKTSNEFVPITSNSSMDVAAETFEEGSNSSCSILGISGENDSTGSVPSIESDGGFRNEEAATDESLLYDGLVVSAKKERKALRKAMKAERRARREGHGNPSAGQKSCDMCGKSVNLLIRCMYEEGQLEWKMVCGKCWNTASGGVVDGDPNHPHYRYGGLWKNRI
eukprot:scaffold23496_cov188-Cylindrotheca_fusiformis.AAC.5